MSVGCESAAVVSRCLGHFFTEVQEGDPWCWLGATPNGAPPQVVASMRDGFLHLICDVDAGGMEDPFPEKALLINRRLSGGVGLVLDPQTRPHLRSDVAILEESRLVGGIERTLAGFRDGLLAFSASAPESSAAMPQDSASCHSILAELLRQSRWIWSERRPGEFSTQLDAEGAPPVTIRASNSDLVFGLDICRMDMAAPVSRRAVALFMLATCGQIRLVRSCSTKTGERETLRLEVGLPAFPAVEEIDHALGALSLAHRISARETGFLLDETAARRYLRGRNLCNHD